MSIFKDRFEAGKTLAKLLQNYHYDKDSIILALPRGGVPVAKEIAKYLNLDMSIFFVKKIPSPWNEEAGIGAVAQNGIVWLDKEIIDRLNIPREYIESKISQKLIEIKQKLSTYNITPPNLENKSVIIVDDGIATGSSMQVATLAIKQAKAKDITIASPVAPIEIKDKLETLANRVVVAYYDYNFIAVGAYYEDFHQLSDNEVIEILKG